MIDLLLSPSIPYIRVADPIEFYSKYADRYFFLPYAWHRGRCNTLTKTRIVERIFKQARDIHRRYLDFLRQTEIKKAVKQGQVASGFLFKLMFLANKYYCFEYAKLKQFGLLIEAEELLKEMIKKYSLDGNYLAYFLTHEIEKTGFSNISPRFIVDYFFLSPFDVRSFHDYRREITRRTKKVFNKYNLLSYAITPIYFGFCEETAIKIFELSLNYAEEADEVGVFIGDKI